MINVEYDWRKYTHITFLNFWYGIKMIKLYGIKVTYIKEMITKKGLTWFVFKKQKLK